MSSRRLNHGLNRLLTEARSKRRPIFRIFHEICGKQSGVLLSGLFLCDVLRDALEHLPGLRRRPGSQASRYSVVDLQASLAVVLLFPFKYPMKLDTAYFGGISTSI